ncbi:hypothetical protein M979_2691 [Buttiauxella noackiae ATCC 51607]|uniref:Uncharacterized protein n=1 Tax=Buttiauxella noackiae ATCC 51607 TaxID=1354255 RepID=A0A1B7HLH0_9ENTR|nr:hypothetical protein M979_2691 [Buttiauxella noackiae ATCC 51607]
MHYQIVGMLFKVSFDIDSDMHKEKISSLSYGLKPNLFLNL